MTIAALGSHRATGRTITEQFHAFDARNPHAYRALERMAARRLAAGATRISLKDSSRTCDAISRTGSRG